MEAISLENRACAICRSRLARPRRTDQRTPVAIEPRSSRREAVIDPIAVTVDCVTLHIVDRPQRA
ncbi:hypothetical protein [Caudoviricetes sp.]|nr:hypothetical protein [Caudoviricetes sp.]